MPKYIIERDIPEIGLSNKEELSQGANKSNEAMGNMAKEKKNIQWLHSYVTNNKTFCVYIADNESLIYEHAESSGFPVSHITEIKNVIDPVTAEL